MQGHHLSLLWYHIQGIFSCFIGKSHLHHRDSKANGHKGLLLYPKSMITLDFLVF
ncbi:hypothetical cytosolic protein [Streptococcus pyogenes MGAS2096]|nr:hypothetical cytosolic protein [Streptococcus pyogenes MGAS2096]